MEAVQLDTKHICVLDKDFLDLPRELELREVTGIEFLDCGFRNEFWFVVWRGGRGTFVDQIGYFLTEGADVVGPGLREYLIGGEFEGRGRNFMG